MVGIGNSSDEWGPGKTLDEETREKILGELSDLEKSLNVDQIDGRVGNEYVVCPEAIGIDATFCEMVSSELPTPNPKCPNPDCDKMGLLRDGPWGSNVVCPECQQYSDTTEKYFGWMKEANLKEGVNLTSEKLADIHSLARLRAHNAVMHDWKPKLDLIAIKKDIETIKTELAALGPADSGDQLLEKLLNSLTDLIVVSNKKLNQGWRFVWNKVTYPYIWSKKKVQPYILRASYRVGIQSARTTTDFTTIIVKYEPTSFGKMLKSKPIHQGYRKVQDGWTAYPHGSAWGHKYCDVSPSMQKFLQRQYINERLIALVHMLESGKL